MHAHTITLTPAAWAFALRPAAGEGRVLLVWRQRSGCTGERFGLRRQTTLPEHHDMTEITLDDGPAWLAIAPEDRPYFEGTQIDLIKSGLNTQLVWSNPQATAACGCGQSVVLTPRPLSEA